MEFKCPKCEALPNECGSKKVPCLGHNGCMGFICDCAEEDTAEDHGTTFSNPCPEANCYHCGWGGRFPLLPRGMQAWEKKAAAAGWTMPDARKKELGL